MENLLFDLIKKLENKPANFLFLKRGIYNYTYFLKTDMEKKLFCMVCKNYLKDSKNINNNKILTIRYWFLYNIFHLMKKEKIKDDGIDELIVLKDYVEFTCNCKSENIFFLPEMNKFSSWINLNNIEKINLHNRLIKEMIYLDDNYFFLINYLKIHDKKFLERVGKREIDEKGNNFMMHLIRSANIKNNNVSLKNFCKIWNYFNTTIYKENILKYIMEKNKNGKRPIHYVSFLKKDYYYFIITNLVKKSGIKNVMETFFWQLVRNIRKFWQFEFLMEKLISLNNKEIGFVELIIPFRNIFYKLYMRLLDNKSVLYYDKLNILKNMKDYGLINVVNEDREKMGRKLWEILGSDNL